MKHASKQVRLRGLILLEGCIGFGPDSLLKKGQTLRPTESEVAAPPEAAEVPGEESLWTRNEYSKAGAIYLKFLFLRYAHLSIISKKSKSYIFKRRGHY